MSAIQPIVVPKWGMEMEEGTISEWHVEEGAPITKGDELVDIETSKIVNTLESNYSGILRKRVAHSGVTLPVGALLGVCADSDVPDSDIDLFISRYVDQLDRVPDENPEIPTESKSDTVKASPSARKLAKELNVDLANVTGTGPRGRISKEDVIKANENNATPDDVQSIKISPVAKRLAKKLNVDISKIEGTGSHGRISKEDVERYAALEKPEKPNVVAVEEKRTRNESANDYDLVPVTTTRKTIAKRLVESKQTIPHFYLTVTCQVDQLIEFRQQINASQTVKVSFNDIVVKAAACALMAEPIVNSEYSDQGIKQYNASHIAIAVATDKGLMTPVIRNANEKGLAEISSQAQDLAMRAQSGQLKLDELSGGTFSISNLGMLGVEEFAAVINPPQAAILAVGAIQQVPGVVNGAVALCHQMKVTLSCDHRVVDGAVGARWLQRFKSYLETPATMLL